MRGGKLFYQPDKNTKMGKLNNVGQDKESGYFLIRSCLWCDCTSSCLSI